MQPKFITLEGGEGVGKTTNLQFIRDWLTAQGIEYVCTREPGGTPLAESLRELLLTPSEEVLDRKAELLMIFAARAQHIATVIKPALAAGKTVLCDRFTDATYAYQGYGRQLGLETVIALETMVQGDFQPDATFLLDAPVEIGMARARARAELDRFEQEATAFFERVRHGYRCRAEASRGRFRVIDAAVPLEQVQAQLQTQLSALFPKV